MESEVKAPGFTGCTYVAKIAVLLPFVCVLHQFRSRRVSITVKGMRVFRRVRKNCGNRVLASSYRSIRPSSCNNSAPIGRIFVKSRYLWIYRKSIEKIHVLLKFEKKNTYYTQRPGRILRRMRNISVKDFVENIKHFMIFNSPFPLSENSSLYEIIW
jgi:hypothetical protein